LVGREVGKRSAIGPKTTSDLVGAEGLEPPTSAL
jgi:hypothetical protein